MKHWTYILLLTVISCNNQHEKVSKSSTNLSDTSQTVSDTEIKGDKEICWIGSLNGKTPVFIHYQFDHDLIIGEITYLNRKKNLPIRLLGTIDADRNYRLLEFDNAGNITGIITGLPSDNTFNGSWFSPKSGKELSLTLSLADTSIRSPDIKPVSNQIFGNYHYQYGENGFNGDFEISKVDDYKVDFSIFSLTNIERGPTIAFSIFSLTNIERGPNIAEVEKDTIALNGFSFVYKIPGSDSCEFKATFYKDFAYIYYTKGYCGSQFGLNATIDGIYLKTK